MATYPITLNGHGYTLSTSDAAQITAIAAARAAYNNTLPDSEAAPRSANANYRATDAAYLQFVFTDWANANPGYTSQQLADAFAATAASYANQDIPPTEDPPPELSPEDKIIALKAYAAEKRYNVEVGGCTVGGLPMPTDRETQAKLTGAYSLAQHTPSMVFQWKTQAGFVSLNIAQIVGIAAAVGTFVQAAFATEAVASVAIDNGDITDNAGIDALDWPS